MTQHSTAIGDFVTQWVRLLILASYNDYDDYRHSDLDWERFSDLSTQLTITDKLQNLNHEIEGQ